MGEEIERFNDDLYDEYARLFREHPFYVAPDVTDWLRDLLEQQSFKEIFQLDG